MLCYTLLSMAKDQVTIFSFCWLCRIIFLFSSFSFIQFVYWCHGYGPCYLLYQKMEQKQIQPINLLMYSSAWSHLSFPSSSPPKLLKIALFVKKWSHRSHAGGLKRHSLTLHLTLAKRAVKYLDQASVWKLFQTQDSTERHFDVIHTGSVGLLHTRSCNLTKLAVSWHGIAYETTHSDIIQELLRSPEEPQAYALTERIFKVVEEVKFFPFYAHHVATSDHAEDILKRIYMIPEDRVHIILNGVDEEIFKPDIAEGKSFKQKFGIPETGTLVLEMAGSW